MPKETSSHKEQIKVTDKRIFTPEGDIREEFRGTIKPSDPTVVTPHPAPTAVPDTPESPQPPVEERRRTVKDKAENPGTPFTNFVEPLVAQGYMSLGMLRNPYQPQPKVDAGAARQMIEILTLLHEKTSGNLTPDEEDFLTTHLGELKLAYVQRTKNLQ